MGRPSGFSGTMRLDSALVAVNAPIGEDSVGSVATNRGFTSEIERVKAGESLEIGLGRRVKL